MAMPSGTVVYLLEHVHEFQDGGEDIKTLGVFSTEASAKQAIEKLVKQPGFRDAPAGFNVDPYSLDQVCWEEGYVTESGDPGETL